MIPTKHAHRMVPFESMCPLCAVVRLQHGFDRASVLRLLSSGNPVEAYCPVCNNAWSISAEERVALAAATTAG